MYFTKSVRVCQSIFIVVHIVVCYNISRFYNIYDTNTFKALLYGLHMKKENPYDSE